MVGGSLWIAIPIAALAGLASFLSPCVLPLVPGYLGFLGGAVAPRESKPTLQIGPWTSVRCGGVTVRFSSLRLLPLRLGRPVVVVVVGRVLTVLDLALQD